ncbi:MAG: glycine C-acetyltransferase [Bacteroidetes bacterium]|jgi:glycine C-acetyltransferase|nr:glycine C-acetyltransferase [Bacteroidota bacterium]
MTPNALLAEELRRMEASQTYKYETPLRSPQGGRVNVGGKEVVMLASNNYLGMSNHPAIRAAAIDGIKRFGYGVASARFLCGTQTIHQQLEKKLSSFVGAEDTILFSSSFAANVGFFSAITNEKMGRETYKDVIYSDRLNHASIIDGQRLSRAEVTDKKIYEHNDVAHLERQLEEDKGKDYRVRMIATDGVFSMEGDMAPLPQLVELAGKHKAMLFVDDCHGVGVMGKTGRGTAEHFGLVGQVDVTIGTLGKAIGGSAGGFISGTKEMVSYLRQKARTYVFSNSLPPSIVMASIAALDLLKKDRSIVRRLHQNTATFRREIQALGFRIIEGIHPVVPVMLGEADVAQKMSAELLKAGVYIKGLWFPVVPHGHARLRAQISAAHSSSDLDRALSAFEKVGKKLGVI